jgi:hypothetical protein
MTTQLATPAAASAPQWNTLQVLKASRAAILLCDALLLIALLIGTWVDRDAMKAIGKDSAPSIIAAQQVRYRLAGMDADAAKALLAPPNTASSATDDFDLQEINASKSLIDAAKNEKTDSAERAPLESLEVSVATYERLIQESQDMHDSGSTDTGSHDNPSPDDVPYYVRYYRGASILMDGTLLAAADDLDLANYNELRNAYNAHRVSSLAALAFMSLAGLAMLAALVWTQMFLSRRTKRTVNPLLVVATLLSLGLILHALIAVGVEEHDLKVAREDAFDSIYALSHARSVAYAANAEESRWLLDPAHASDYERAFAQDSADLMTLPPDIPLATVLRREDSGEHVAGFSGYLADELHNTTFPGEREAAAATLTSFDQYLKIDAHIRSLEHPDAVTACIGTNPGDSGWAFTQFNKALTRTLEINQDVFKDEVAAGLSALKGMEWKASIAAALIAIFAVLGLSARIREYE